MFARLRTRSVKSSIVLSFGILAAVIIAVLASNYRDAWQHVYESNCNGCMCAISQALLQYEGQHGCFPPAHVDAPDGRRMHSWRALIEEYSHGYLFPYDFREPWDGPNNTKLGARPESFPFACPSDPDAQRNKRLTNYFVVEGANTAFPGARTLPTKNTQFDRGRSNTILMVEAVGLGIEWLEPRDLDYNTMSFLLNDPTQPSISSHHPQGPHARMADGSVRSLRDISPEVLKSMLTMPEQGDPDDRSENDAIPKPQH